jgi:hypothetical protein
VAGNRERLPEARKSEHTLSGEITRDCQEIVGRLTVNMQTPVLGLASETCAQTQTDTDADVHLPPETAPPSSRSCSVWQSAKKCVGGP